MKFYGNIEHNLDIINKKYADEHYADKEDIKSTNLLDGEGEKSVEQIHDTNSWNTSNEWVKTIVEENLPNENGTAINGTFDGTNATISVGAYGKLSTMMNGKSQTVGGKSHAEGSKTIAFENNAHAEGNETLAAGKHSHAEGNLSTAFGNASHAEGTSTIAIGAQSHSEGYNTTAEGDFAHSEGAETKAMDFYSHAEGYDTKATGVSAHAEGYQTIASGAGAHSEGQFNEASGIASHIEGSGNKILDATYSHVEGLENTAEGDVSHTEGWNNQILEGGNYSHIEGAKNELKGAFSHVEGYNNQVSSDHSHVEGGEHQVFATYSHVEGHNNTSHGYGAHVEGAFNIAQGSYNHVNGFGNNSDGDYQTVIGKANKKDSSKAFIIGNGEVNSDFTIDNNKRKNAMEVDWEGNAWVANDIKIGKSNTSVKDKINNVYSKEASNFLLGAESVSLSETVHLSGNILQKNNIYTESPSFNLGQEAEITSRWFGYIGIKNIPLNKNYLLVAEIDINTEFNMNIARVQSFYKTDENSSSKPEGTIIGIPNNGKNYILFPFTPTSGKPIKGFYFDAQGSNNPTVSLLVKTLKLYETTTLENVSINDGYKDWKKEFYYTGNLVKNSLENDYVLIYDTNSNIIASSLSNAQDIEIILYKSLSDNYVNKDELNNLEIKTNNLNDEIKDISKIITSKGITFTQYPPNSKCLFEPGCLYYVRASTETIHFYKNGEMISYYTSGFDNGVVAMASNIYQGAHVNYFAAPKITGGIFGGGTMNGYTIATTETDEVYAMSVADSGNSNPSVMNVWKIKI